MNSLRFQADEITIIDPAEKHFYQPGFTNIGAGLWGKDWSNKEHKYISRDMEELVKVNFKNTGVEKFRPEENKLVLQTGEEIEYEYLIVATGVENRYDQIPGSLDALYDQECPVGSIYDIEFAHKMSDLRKNFAGGKALFAVPEMPIKCGGAPQKIMYLSDEKWRKLGVRSNTEIHFFTSLNNMFPNCQIYADALEKIAIKKGVNIHYGELMTAINGANRTATFLDCETGEFYDREFDLLHMVPPQTPHACVRRSNLVAETGFVDVDRYTLRHNKYNNVWSVGDVSNTPTAKTAAAIFRQVPVVVH